MNRTLQNRVLKELCPNGIWQPSATVKALVRYHIARLPESKVSENGTRYPKNPAEMRAFLIKFFTRHYFQTQHSLFDYMTSNDFLNLLTSGKLQILDIGCGPAVASLAITDLLVCIVEHHKDIGKWPKGKTVKIAYLLNDTSGACLGTGQRMLSDYFSISKKHSRGIIHGRTISVQKAFPVNMNQLRRVQRNLGTYDIITFSYAIVPLDEDNGLTNLADGLLNIETLCSPHGRILILQDKFKAPLMRRLSRAIGTSSHQEELTQHVYPNRNTNETHTYTYYRCLYGPTRK
jgi:SAM-dependent methyltransferase